MNRVTQASIVREFSQADFDRFASLSGDNNPIHTDPEHSAQTRFGRTVAHGLLLCSVLRGLIDKLVPGGRLTAQSVMFPAPTYAGEAMQFTVRLTNGQHGNNPDSFDVDLEIRRVADGIVTCQGQAAVRI